MDGDRSLDGRGRRLREAEVANLAGRDELGHRTDGVLDGRLGVRSVQVVQIDVVDAESLERCVAGLRHVRRRSVDAHPPVTEDVAELGGQHDLIAPVGDGAADQPLVVGRAVDVGRVEEGDAELEGSMDGGDRLVLVGRAVGEVRHAHAAEALGRDGQAGISESARWDRHGYSKVENDQRPECAPTVTVILTPGRASPPLLGAAARSCSRPRRPLRKTPCRYRSGVSGVHAVPNTLHSQGLMTPFSTSPHWHALGSATRTPGTA